MKAPTFLLYTGDFLSSPDVQLMEAHEVGAYCLLLFNSWQSDRPGFLPNDEDRLRRIARLTPAQWAPSRALLLGKFPPAAADPALRHNPRLVREAAKQAAKRERLAANGRKGGRPEKQLLSPENHLLAQNATLAPEPTPEKQLLSPAKQKLLAAKQLPPKTQAIEKAFNFSFNTTSNEVVDSNEVVEEGAAAPAPPSKKKSLARPSLPDVQAYAAGQYPGSAEAPAEAAAFFDHFESNGWRVGGKTPMADWQAAFRSWMRRRPQFQGPASPAAPARAKSAPKPHDPARWSYPPPVMTPTTQPARLPHRATVSVPRAGHLPPQALDLEAAVLGAALLEADAQRTLLATLTTEDVFYCPAHQQVYLAIRDLVLAGQPADLLTVVAQLRHRGTLARTGGPAFVAGLTSKINSAAHLDTHCRLLQEQHARRVIIRAGSELAAHGYDDTRDPLALLTDAQAHLTSLNRTLETRPGQTAAAFDATFAQLTRAVGQQGHTGVSTGLAQLDGLTGGWQPDLIILAARPAMGKTAALLHFARTAALDHGQHTAIFSLEMPTLQLMQRLVASEVPGYSNSDLRRGNLPGGVEQVAYVQQQAQRLRTHGHRLHLDDTPGLSLQQLRAKCARLHAQHPLGLVLVDYLQLMRGDQKGNREQEVGSLSRGLKELAKELNAPVIALSQLSRDVEKRGGEKRPLLSDLRESGSLEQDADCILFMWRGEYYNIAEYEDGTRTADTVLFDIAKHRNGATDEVIAACNLRRGVFADLKHYAEL